MRNATETLDWLKAQHTSGSTAWYRLCLGLATAARDITPKYPTAYAAWQGSNDQHKPAAPVVWAHVPIGAPLFYSAPPENGVIYGHVATFIGVTSSGPLCWTNDALRLGGVDAVHPLFFVSHWGHPFLGWTGDLNGVDLHLQEPHPPNAQHKVSVSSVAKAAHLDPRRNQGTGTPGCLDDVRLVESALHSWGHLDVQYVDGAFGTATVNAYKAWQHYIGFTGKDADGIPGEVSLARLGARFNFTLTV